jgi:hypothetical protein
MGYNARNDEIRDNGTRMRRERIVRKVTILGSPPKWVAPWERAAAAFVL